MKKIALIFVTTLAFGFTSCDSDDDSDLNINQVPETVITAFETEFPNATDIDYEKKGDQYEVDFEIDNIDYDALFTADGNLVKYKKDVSSADVPQAILDTIANDYPNLQIDDSELLIVDDNTYYQIELDNEPNDEHLVFNLDGTINDILIFWE